MITTVTLNPAVDKRYEIEELQPERVMRVKEITATAGGKGLNVSRVCALAGEAVTAMGFVGGHNGGYFESLIEEPGIHGVFTKVKAETRCCINIWDTKRGKSTELLEPGSEISSSELQAFLLDFEAMLPKSDIVAISGSIPKGLPTDIYASLIHKAKTAGKRVFLDTSGEALLQAITAKPYFIKPNTDEIAQILQVDIHSKEQLIAAARRLHQDGIAVVAVSLGKDGVLVVAEEGVFHGITPDIPVVNTVGCGDSMVAGFAVAAVRGQDIVEAIRFAVAVSTANALTKQTGSFLRQDLQRLLPQVRVERLSV